MINIIFGCFISSIIIFSYGVIFTNNILKQDIIKINHYEVGVFSFIIIGTIALFINFFLALDKIVGSIFLIISILYFIRYFIKSKKKKEIIYIILFATFITFTILTLSNINRPDAGLYHLPYISVLNENKIIVGLTNLHYRFGHVSIFQYISAIYNNHFFIIEFINLPLASVFSFFLIFLLEKLKNFEKKNNEQLIIITFLITVFSLYSFNRYSNYGNDTPVHIYFFILIIFFLQIHNIKKTDNRTFYKITLISIFLFTLKPFMLIALIIPFFLLLINESKIKLLKSYNLLFCSLFIFLWLIKNLMISGCIIFPVKSLCLKKAKYLNIKTVVTASTEAEAWAKGFPDQKGTKLNFKNYNSNFNWFTTWKSNHYKKIKEKILPFLIFLILFIIPFIFKKILKKKFQFNKVFPNKNILILIFFTFVCICFWLFKFPVYRFGLSFINGFIILVFTVILMQLYKFTYSNKNLLWIIIMVGLLGFSIKNYGRIINDYKFYYNNFPWPRIYTLNNSETNKPKNFLKINDKNNNFLFYYSGGVECMYSKSPCTNIMNKNLKKEKLFGYTVYSILN